MRNRKSFPTTILSVAYLGLLLAASSASAATAFFDIGGTPVQSGYTGLSGNSAATSNGITITTAGWTGTQNPGDASLDGNPLEDLYSDYLYGNESTITISGLGLNTPYTLTIYAYAGGNSALAANWYVGANDGTPDHVWSQTAQTFDESVAKFTLSATSSGTGTILLSVDNTAKTSRFNGIEIVPEPSTALLGGLGLLALLRRRR